jgi:hypothetical protein
MRDALTSKLRLTFRLWSVASGLLQAIRYSALNNSIIDHHYFGGLNYASS